MLDELVILGYLIGACGGCAGDMDCLTFCQYEPNDLGKKVFPDFPPGGALNLMYESGNVEYYDADREEIVFSGPLNLEAFTGAERYIVSSK